MDKYVVFAGRNRGMPAFDKTMGYLEALLDQSVLEKPFIAGEIWKPEYELSEINLNFAHDEKIKEVLSQMSLPKMSIVIRAKVRNESSLRELAPHLCRRYDLDFRIYET